MLAMILRQYRRWLFASALFFVWFQVTLMVGTGPSGKATERSIERAEAFWSDGEYAFGITWRLAVFALVLVLVLTVLVAALLPAGLPYIEIVPIVLGIGSIAHAILPDVGVFRLLERALPILVAIVLLTAYGGLGKIGKFGAKDVRLHVNFKTSATPDMLFRRLVPTIDGIKDFHVVGSRVFSDIPPGPAEFFLATPPRYGHGLFVEEVRLEEMAVPQSARYSTKPLNQGRNFRFPPASRRDVKINPTPEGSEVTIQADLLQVPLAFRLHWFLIQIEKDAAACWKARVEGQKDWSILGRTTIGPAPQSELTASEVK